MLGITLGVYAHTCSIFYLAIRPLSFKICESGKNEWEIVQVWHGYAIYRQTLQQKHRKYCRPTLAVLNPIDAAKATAGADISYLVLKTNLSYIKVCRQQDSHPNIMAHRVLFCPSFHLSNILALQVVDLHFKTRYSEITAPSYFMRKTERLDRDLECRERSQNPYHLCDWTLCFQ